jgi:predicted polyphosphate/ATP-dependent NAD kinase
MATTRSGTVGVIANPAAGKDVRRLVAYASPTSDAAKIGIVRRAVLGAIGGGAARILIAPDRHNLSHRAVTDLDQSETRGVEIEFLDEEVYGYRGDTVAIAKRFAKDGVDVVIVLGGDGTHRDVALGWLDAPMVAISTGTNNVFPRAVDATMAGLAAGLVASRYLPQAAVAFQSKVVHATFSDGTPDDLALVDLAVTRDQFTGSRAVWSGGLLRELITCIAEPTAVGLSSIAGLLQPIARREPGGVHVVIDTSSNRTTDTRATVRAVLAPGMLAEIPYETWAFLPEGDTVTIHGPGVLAFDGERDRELSEDAQCFIAIRRDGPLVVDVDLAITLAATRGYFHSAATPNQTSSELPKSTSTSTSAQAPRQAPTETSPRTDRGTSRAR